MVAVLLLTVVCFSPNSFANDQLCQTEYIPVYGGWSSCYGSGYWDGDYHYDWIDEYVPSTFASHVWIDVFTSQPFPGGWLSCYAPVPFSHNFPYETCEFVESFFVDGNQVALFESEQSEVAFSQNMGSDFSESMSWTNPGQFSTRFEYRIDFGTSGQSAGSTDVSWSHYLTYGAGIANGTITYNVGPITINNVPYHQYNSPSQFYNPNNYAKLYYRMRLEDSQGAVSQWRYTRAIWVHYMD
jgi:hypothetical protein